MGPVSTLAENTSSSVRTLSLVHIAASRAVSRVAGHREGAPRLGDRVLITGVVRQ